ncbi:radical SAM protein [Photobacterium galatheae]|uniref:Radical SAM core domain-containing protein n=1 Tax=Photobacterium galatheae TaxID=1654360 RepID=A0A066RLV8_9GAMM|nr:radical SAM protein [Photobacterium galatheae]KDM90106.1 hypothetical protein EA58_19425 [Photobacterium galatheae]MCM0151629.1 radical SAM protein [Photobacterium galatheae]
MITANNIAIHLTYTCPLECSHCCFQSGPKVKTRLSEEIILDTVNAIDPEKIKMVAFTGGEPFLLYSTLLKAVEIASKKGVTTRVVTSAYFATSENNARKKLKELKDFGLDEISISWDDYHEEYVDFDVVRNAFLVSKSLGIRAAINIVQDANSKWDVSRVVLEMNGHCTEEDVLCETNLNLTGRAKEKLSERNSRNNRLLGPCPYVLSGPTLNAKGNLLACCGVIEEQGPLVISNELIPSEIMSDIENSYSNLLHKWLYLRGPFALLEEIRKKFDVPIPLEEHIGGNCESCQILFGSEYFGYAVEILKDKAQEIVNEEFLLSSMNMLDAKYTIDLWGKNVVNEKIPIIQL